MKEQFEAFVPSQEANKMKKLITIITIMALTVSLAGCRNFTATQTEGASESSVAEAGNAETSGSESSAEFSESSAIDESSKVDESSTNSNEESTTADSKTDESSEQANESSEHAHDWKPVYKTVHHDAEYKTVHHEAETHTIHHVAVNHTLHHETENDTVHHEAEYKEENTLVSYTATFMIALFKDGHTIDPYDYNFDSSAYKTAVKEYANYLVSIGVDSSFSNGGRATHTVSVEIYNKHSDLIISATPNYETTRVLVKEAWDEQVLVRAAYDETVVDQAAYDETVVDKEAWDETVLVKDAYDEQVIDHYECACGERKY